MDKNITKRQEDVLNYIKKYTYSRFFCLFMYFINNREELSILKSFYLSKNKFYLFHNASHYYYTYYFSINKKKN